MLNLAIESYYRVLGFKVFYNRNLFKIAFVVQNTSFVVLFEINSKLRTWLLK